MWFTIGTFKASFSFVILVVFMKIIEGQNGSGMREGKYLEIQCDNLTTLKWPLSPPLPLGNISTDVSRDPKFLDAIVKGGGSAVVVQRWNETLHIPTRIRIAFCESLKDRTKNITETRKPTRKTLNRKHH